jgi:hypothetical protein
MLKPKPAALNVCIAADLPNPINESSEAAKAEETFPRNCALYPATLPLLKLAISPILLLVIVTNPWCTPSPVAAVMTGDAPDIQG